MSSIEELKHLQISLQDISDATNDFSDENCIGLGGFGQVYKGISEKYGTIAVKRLSRDLGEHSQGDREFKTEIALLSNYKHENIVSLLGYCDEDGEKILVYKYESQGSLDKHLKSADLTWTQRLNICLDAARGLKYLHHDVGAEHRTLHRDVKSANILLDENWNAKISDFGLSKKGPNVPDSFVSSNPCGTKGYICPEYETTGYLTPKSDVFSFGVVLFEVLCGRPAYAPVDDQPFYIWVQKSYKRKTLNSIIHSGLHEQINPASLHAFSTIAYQCLKNGEERPTMKEVVEQLQKALGDQMAPSEPRSDDFDALHQRQSRNRFDSTFSMHVVGIREYPLEGLFPT
ncbi:putative protein kinase RLK-Pelle-CrRLK1L-1 family [Helianthus annuus]|uniref:Protein kinase domain-containing protein n=1 Tax=Helianthus annuus TaxID=4232 RepID=A0A9K3NBX2_HELAN|nr:putative protein kinase RLK-Pelle-CrRLK1L-1 family [Helianthus annuus]